jgi:hypothetical protein
MRRMADAPRRWFRFRLRTLLFVTMLVVIAAACYSYWTDYSEQAARRERELLSPARGAACTVILRDEALGVASAAGRPAWRDRDDNFVAGKFYLMNDDWVVVDLADGAQQWIPRAHVLMLRVEE